ncbi:MAG TPA: glycosyltransferase family A protein [Candidatus Binataceae bacterium]|nr:glycosyltransferase family A protein [Candidatus Binataceae bacterium]
MAPRVSVLVPVYNAAATVAAALDSILGQSFTDFEIVAVDDGSNDDSLSMLERYQPRITVLSQQNRGPSAARNLGERNSSGEYLAFLDADDLWRPEFLARTVAMLDSHPECVLVYTDLELADSTGAAMGARLIGKRGVPTVRDMLERLWPILPSSVVMRRGAFERAGGFPEELTSFEDVYFWLLAREQGDFGYIEEPLTMWRFAHYPAALKPAGGQEAAGRIFDQMLQRRYGVRGLGHVAARERAPRSILGYIGLHAIVRGDRRAARRAFAAALRTDPWRLRNYLRYARTFMPDGLARALSGTGAGKSGPR